MTEEEKVEESEPEVVVEQPDDQPDVEVEAAEPESPEPDKKGEWVELSPEAQRKFNEMYKQTKMSDQRNKLKDEMLDKAMKRIDELESRFKQTDESQAEQIILQRIQEARDNGDTSAEMKFISELTDFKAEQKIKSIQQPKQPQQVDFGLPDDDVSYLKDAVFEKDNSGNYVRPWLHENNPRYRTTLQQSAIISAEVEAELGYIDAREVMTRLEKVMTQKSTPQRTANNRSPDPLQSSLTTKNVRGTLKLNPSEAAMAEKLGISTKDYALAKQKYKI